MFYKERQAVCGQPEYDRTFWNYIKGRDYTETALGLGMSTENLSYALPNYADNALEKAIAEKSIFRNIATVHHADGSTPRIIVAESNDIAKFIPEMGSINTKAAAKDFTNISVGRYKLATLLKLSNEFARDAAFDLEHYLIRRLGKAYARAEDAAFVNGTGSEEPTGILDDTNGADIGVTAAEITFDDVIRLFFSVAPEFRKSAVWMMNDETALALRLLKDADGNHLWNQANDTIMGKKVIICNDMPSADSGKKPVAFGDFSYYWIVKRGPITLRRLIELYYLTSQTGYLSYEFLDGKLIRRDAVKVLAIGNAADSAVTE